MGRKQRYHQKNLALIIGTGGSIALGLALYATDVDGIHSLIVGLVGTSIGLGFEIIERLSRHDAGQSMLSAAGRHGPELTSIAESITAIDSEFPHGTVSKVFNERLEKFVDDIGSMAQGRVVYQGSDYRGLLESMSGAMTRVEAVTNYNGIDSNTLTWWDSDTGRQYWAKNEAALNSNVSITRIFIVNSTSQIDLHLKALLIRQRDAGVRVRWVERQDIEPEYHLNLAIWDGRIAWQANTNARGTQFENVIFCAERDVSRLQRAFDVLMIASRDF